MNRILTGTALVLACAAPAYAQSDAPICGGISLVGEWVGGNEADSDLTAATTLFELEGEVPIAGHLVRMFTLSEPTDIRIDVAALPAGDPYISVYDAAGAEVAADDDSGGNFASRVEATLDAGTYCLAARSYESGITDISVRIGRFDHDFGEDAPVEAPSAPDLPALPLGNGAGCFRDDTARLADDVTPADMAGGLYATDTVSGAPAYAFSLAEPTALSVTASSETGDPLIRLLDANGSVLGENDDFDGLDSRIDVTQALDPGEYCIEVEDLNGTENAIEIGLQAFDPAADRLRRLNAAEFAPTASDTVDVTDLGTIDTVFLQDVTATGDATWFRFTLPEGGLLVTEAIGDGTDPTLALFDRVGRRLAENDDGPEGLDSFLVTKLFPGTYTLALRLVDQGGSGNVRLLMERYVPAQ